MRYRVRRAGTPQQLRGGAVGYDEVEIDLAPTATLADLQVAVLAAGRWPNPIFNYFLNGEWEYFPLFLILSSEDIKYQIAWRSLVPKC